METLILYSEGYDNICNEISDRLNADMEKIDFYYFDCSYYIGPINCNISKYDRIIIGVDPKMVNVVLSDLDLRGKVVNIIGSGKDFSL